MSTDLHTRIYLTGFMGSGKTVSGPHAARMLHYRFVDIDHRIEQATGLKVREIFSERGEDEFRRLEREAVHQVVTEERVVVSLGGGAVADPTLRARLLETGLLVWLRTSPEVIARRLARTAYRRPLLCDPDGSVPGREALVDRVRLLLQSREPFYEAAHVTVDADTISAKETARRIVEEVRRACS